MSSDAGYFVRPPGGKNEIAGLVPVSQHKGGPKNDRARVARKNRERKDKKHRNPPRQEEDDEETETDVSESADPEKRDKPSVDYLA